MGDIVRHAAAPDVRDGLGGVLLLAGGGGGLLPLQVGHHLHRVARQALPVLVLRPHVHLEVEIFICHFYIE